MRKYVPRPAHENSANYCFSRPVGNIENITPKSLLIQKNVLSRMLGPGELGRKVPIGHWDLRNILLYRIVHQYLVLLLLMA